VSGQLHVPATLPSGKDPPPPIGEEVGWTPESVWTTWRRENFVILLGLELRLLNAKSSFKFSVHILTHSHIHGGEMSAMFDDVSYIDRSETRRMKFEMLN
jgi:hypothetical protein